MAGFTPIGVEATVKNIQGYVSDLGKMEAANKRVSKTTDQMGKDTQKATGGMGFLQNAITGLTAGALLYMGQRIARGALELGTLGATAERQEAAFRSLAETAGQSADDIVAAMMRAAGGSVDDEDLMMAANKALIGNFKMTAEDYGLLTELVRRRSRALGVDMTSMLTELFQGIATGRARGLMTMGFTEAQDVMKQYGEDLGDGASKMQIAERSQALLNMALGKAKEEHAALGPVMDDSLDKIVSMGVAWGNFKEELGKKVNPVVIPVVVGATKVARGESGIGAWIDALKQQLETKTVIPLKTAGGALEQLAIKERAVNAETARWVGIGAAYTAQVDKARAATRKFVDSLPKLSDAEGWKALEAVAARMGKNTKAAADAVREGIYKGLEAQGEAVVANEKATSDQRTANQKLADDTTKALKDAAKESADAWQSAYDSLRSDVEAALQPTEVTIADWVATAAGTYVDKWDENVRRLNAIAERGFSEIQAHSDWASVLSIPPDILAGSEQQLRDWAKGVAANPPAALLDVNAAVAQVEQYMAQKAAHAAFIDAVTAEYARRHGLSAGAAKAAVGGGLEEPEYIMGNAAKKAEPIGQSVVDGMKAGILAAWPDFSAWLLEKIAALAQTATASIASTTHTATGGGAAQAWGGGSGGGLVNALPVILPSRGGTTRTTVVGGDTITQNINDPQTLTLALALVADKKRERWNRGMGVVQ